MSPTDTRVYAYIRERITQGMPPTRREIAAHFGWAAWTVASHYVRRLEKAGMLKLVPGTARGIRLSTLSEQDGPCAVSCHAISSDP